MSNLPFEVSDLPGPRVFLHPPRRGKEPQLKRSDLYSETQHDMHRSRDKEYHYMKKKAHSRSATFQFVVVGRHTHGPTTVGAAFEGTSVGTGHGGRRNYKY